MDGCGLGLFVLSNEKSDENKIRVGYKFLHYIIQANSYIIPAFHAKKAWINV